MRFDSFSGKEDIGAHNNSSHNFVDISLVNLTNVEMMSLVQNHPQAKVTHEGFHHMHMASRL